MLLAVTIAALLAMIGFVIATSVDPAIMGARGTAVITRCPSYHRHTSYYGTFRTNDGTVNVKDEQIQGEDGASPGERFTAYYTAFYYTAFNHSVGTVGSTEDLIYAAITIAVLLAATLFQLWNLVIRPAEPVAQLIVVADANDQKPSDQNCWIRATASSLFISATSCSLKPTREISRWTRSAGRDSFGGSAIPRLGLMPSCAHAQKIGSSTSS